MSCALTVHTQNTILLGKAGGGREGRRAGGRRAGAGRLTLRGQTRHDRAGRPHASPLSAGCLARRALPPRSLGEAKAEAEAEAEAAAAAAETRVSYRIARSRRGKGVLMPCTT